MSEKRGEDDLERLRPRKLKHLSSGSNEPPTNLLVLSVGVVDLYICERVSCEVPSLPEHAFLILSTGGIGYLEPLEPSDPAFHRERAADPRPVPSHRRAGQSVSSLHSSSEPSLTTSQRPLAPFLPTTSSQPPDLASLLSLTPQTYSSRLSGKTITLSAPTTSGPSALVTGKKRNRGDDNARTKARSEVQDREREMTEAGLVGLRKVRRRLSGRRDCVGKGMRIS